MSAVTFGAVVVFEACVLLRALRADGALAIVAWVVGPQVVLAVLLVALGALVSVAGQRALRRAATAPVPEMAEPGPGHRVLAPQVEELGALGYGVVGAWETRQEVAALMLHPDGSVATAVARRSGRFVVVVLTSCLLPGTQWLRTVVSDASDVTRSFLVDALPPRAPVSEQVRRHRDGRSWLESQGIGVVHLGPGDVVTDLVARRRARADDAALGRFALHGKAVRTRPLAAHPDLAARLELLRAAQARFAADWQAAGPG